MTRSTSWFALGLAALGLVACSGPAKETTLLIDVRSGLVAPTEVDELVIHVVGAESGTTLDKRFALTGFPQTYLVRAASYPNQVVTITVTATSAGAERIRRVVSSRFVEGVNGVVVIDLDRSCLDIICPEGVDCVAVPSDGAVIPGFCEGVPTDGGQPDLGPHDAGLDGGPCIPTGAELCDGVDNDCNGTIDDGFDLQTDTQNCGRCGRICGALPNGNNNCVAGECTLACDLGRDDCDGIAADGCEADLATAATCGSCTTACTGDTPACEHATDGTYSCVSGCTAPTPTLCSGSCVDLASNAANCGSCGGACTAPPNSVATCAANVCGFVCRPGFEDCDGIAANGCEADLGTSVGSCGSCGYACALTNATPACTSGLCTVDACDSGFADCDLNPNNGCELPLDTLTDCGGCGVPCARTNAATSCAGGVCALVACNVGFGDCDSVPGNGCETPLTTLVNCGACGTSCGRAFATATCATGTCSIASCNSGFGDCDGSDATGCETPLTTTSNCGGCSTECVRANAATSCPGGTCGTTSCAPGYGDCDGNVANGCETPLNTLTDCGGCGTPCAVTMGNPSCMTGVCVSTGCRPGYADCDLVASNGCETSLDGLANCGACGTVCDPPNAGASCSGSICRVVSCDAGFGDCDLVASNGCETPLTTLANCGSCGTACSRPNGASTCATGTCALTTCNSSFGNCDLNESNGCESTLTTLTNCGACGTACTRADATPTCAAGNCETASCNAGFADCDSIAANGCETSLDTLASCGACGAACTRAHATASCSAGSCTLLGCNSGFGNCDLGAVNGCEAPLTTATDCGACGTPCVMSNAASSCATGSCALGACNPGFGNCDANAANGCEAPLTTVSNCGGCGTTCTRANASASCASGTCAIGTCNSGFGNCDANAANGCETPLTTLANCGGCATACTRANATATCGSGSCQILTCAPGFGNCDGNDANGCEAALTSTANCGACGVACTRTNAGATCATGTCAISSCNGGFGNCDATDANGCETALTSLTNCASCGTACSRVNAAASCASGTCALGACNALWGNCDANAANGCERPLNTLTDCSTCGTICDIGGSSETCASGTCVATTCAAGLGDCDGLSANGCEQTLNTLTHCGACAAPCTRTNATPTCSTGACAISSCSAGFGDCDATDANGCETALTSLTSCAACGTACSRANAAASCSTGACTLGTCNAGYGNCDGVASNGCEAPLTSLTNCSACGAACARSNATPTCSTGSCAISACSAGFGNCDGTDSNGCEVALTTLANCASCGTVCARANAAASCSTGTCTIGTCNASFGNCDADAANGCETALTTLANCASCGTACSRANAAASCATGACALGACDAGFGNCDANATNGCETSLSSLTSCGACGTACTRANAAATCATGSCAIGSCSAGYGDCDLVDSNGCEAALTTVTNCATCGTPCARANAAASCTTGTCTLGACSAGFGNCDGIATNGCEQPTNTLTHCGGCNTACTRAHATATCSTGSCAIGACTGTWGNCDGNDANGCEATLGSYYRDADGDGYGAGTATRACTAPVGYVANNTDCNDANAAVNPGHAEVCANGIDDNCAGGIDEGCASGACTGSTAVALPGGRFSVVLAPNVETGSCGGAGSEATLSFTVTALSDAFITTLGTSIDTVVYVRSLTCAGTEVGCNDDADGSASSTLHLTGLAAGTYNVFIDTKVAMSASISVDVYVADTAPAGDRCSNPTFIPAGTANITGTTCGFAKDYSASTGQGDCNYAGDGADAERVYYFYLPVARTVRFNGCQPATVADSTAYLRRICSQSGLSNQVACGEDNCTGGSTCAGAIAGNISVTNLPAGVYYFFADGYWETPTWACSCGAYQYNLTGI